jgi:hypothetical protein
VNTCDKCHAKEVNGKPAYSTEIAKTEAACNDCHDMDSRKFAQENPSDETADVHFARGMRCMECHSAREIHGDGKLYDSMRAPGATDARCENCHKDLSKCPASAVHHGKLDCSACHVRKITSCYNCHVDTLISEGKEVSLPLQDTLFLINYNGKVTPASLHTFIYQNKTMIVFAPAFSHWIMKGGRKCADCHATPAIQQMQTGSFKLVVWNKTGLKNVTGIIPVLEGFRWDFPFSNYVNGEWVPTENAAQPLLNYSGYSKPITREQIAKLARRQSTKP